MCEDVAPSTYPVQLRGALIENDPVVTLGFAKCVRMWYLVVLTVFSKCTSVSGTHYAKFLKVCGVIVADIILKVCLV